MMPTGSGMRFNFNNSTCTVVGNWETVSHSPSFEPLPPPIWVKDQSCNKRVVFELILGYERRRRMKVCSHVLYLECGLGDTLENIAADNNSPRFRLDR